MNVTIFGIGYVGLVQAAVLADAGHHVICVDSDKEKVKNLKKGVIPIYEPGLATIVEENYKADRLVFTTDVKIGVEYGDIQFIAVGTPADEDGSADLKYVLAVADSIANYMETPKIIINKSTVPVGTADRVSKKIIEVLELRGVSLDYHVVSNPEFLKEGSAVEDCQKPERIVIGINSNSNYVINAIKELYAPFNYNYDRMIWMDVRSAELTKYAANCMLATKISFMNEMANLAEKLGADIEAVRKGIGSDSRIGYQFIYPGCGYGGSCFPKDVQALIKTADSISYNAEILKSVDSVNYRQKEKLFEKINKHYDKNLKGKTFAIWGLSFKPNTDDMREAPSRVLMESLWNAGAKVQAFDPEAMEECQRIYGQREDLTLMVSQNSALKGADALIIVTEWENFKVLDIEYVSQLLKEPLIFDGRNLFSPERLKNNGIKYYSIGR
jgi:UDPglucose 6-dehydrogenase